MSAKKIAAFAYMRTSSAANTGPDKDSDKRQAAAIEAFADANGYIIESTFYDAAVSGADPIDERPGMLALLDAVLANGTRVILCESPDRFARDPIVQTLGHRMLKEHGVELIPTTAPDYFTEETPTAELVRDILGAISAFERKQLVARLRGARKRRSAALGRACEGRKPVPDATIQEARRLYRRSPKTGQRRSLRDIAEELGKLGHHAPSGQVYNPGSVRQMLERAGVYQPAAPADAGHTINAEGAR
ncbi:recombinase family protein [Silicimonas algicola]|uniref:DNA invertase Pin-like site-specific DNA recombinase n=1 Tax=Silicimonas algicola TaxID=1826607 RepID=A0A316G3V0_9RHOB|nr:recombinase family protein [Silicimonas algicola]AZQ66821.1 recombinase family protein [Silicimonas algicola]PWK55272.1 DNA invertase Pin-like site-specific DNA recombinase [Silicimonas algicola]